MSEMRGFLARSCGSCSDLDLKELLEKTSQLAQTVMRDPICLERAKRFGLTVVRYSSSAELECAVYQPTAILILQGEKRSYIGGGLLKYGEGDCLLTGVDLPVRSWHTNASGDHPFCAVGVSLSREAITKTLSAVELDSSSSQTPRGFEGFSLWSKVADQMFVEAFRRALLSLGEPHSEVFCPLAIEEIHARLLFSPAAGALKQFFASDSSDRRIHHAIARIRRDFALPLKLENLASEANMSESSFSRHFKQLTALSPIQYQKQLRLHEARRLLLAGGIDARQAAFAVGYVSPQQFSREYKRLFGQTPRMDAIRKKMKE